MSFEQQIQTESEQFCTLLSRLSDTQWSETAMPEAQSRLATCQSEIRLTQDAIDVFNATADKNHKHLDHIKRHGIQHAWYKVQGKLEQRLDEQEKTWLEAYEKCKEQELRLIFLKEQMDSAQKHLHHCQAAYQKYATAKRTLDQLLEDLFSGVTPYPDQDIMKQNLKKEEENLTALRDKHGALTHLFYLVQRAHQAIIVSRRELDCALNMNTVDWFSHSALVDMPESFHLAKARAASVRAQQYINKANHVYRNLLQIGALHIDQDNLAFNIIFDDIWTDMNMRRMIHEASDRISHADVVLTRTLLEIERKLAKCKSDQDTTSKDMKRLAAELFTTRITIVRNIIDPPPPYSAVMENEVTETTAIF
jgi:tetratricopeptide (TPR) repeat protein